MKNILWIIFIMINSFISCNRSIKKETKTQKRTTFDINGIVFDVNNKTVLLTVLHNNSIESIDSTTIINNSFHFTGSLNYPKKAFIQIKNYNSFFPFIISNDSCLINLNTSQLQKSTIKNSPINDTLNKIKEESALIYSKINYLYPLLQKARIENDIVKLNDINSQIKAINIENDNYLYSFIDNHPDNYLSGLLINDLWHSTNRDSVRIKKLASNLSDKVKQTIDFAIH